MSISLGIIMDPIEAIHYKKDSTLAMLLAAQKKGWNIHYMQAQQLYVGSDHKVRSTMRELKVFADPKHWFEWGDSSDEALGDLDVVLMRTDPPFNMNYIYATYLLERAQEQGCLVVNNPRSVRDCNEKLFATQFPQCCPPLVVSSQQTVLRDFHSIHQDVIFKPLDGMGGASIFRVGADGNNLGVVLETLTQGQRVPIMAQRFIPEISQGDKRILLIGGEPQPYALARIPSHNEHRGNLAAGGSGEARALTERDRWICQQVAPTLREKGLMFVGLDVIGDYLTEINVTSPTCIRELDNAHDLDIAGQLMNYIESLL